MEDIKYTKQKKEFKEREVPQKKNSKIGSEIH